MLIITFLSNPKDKQQEKTRLVQSASTFGEQLPLMFVELQCEQ